MNLFLLKRDHHDGQTIYGVYENEKKVNEAIEELFKLNRRIKRDEYEILEIRINELYEIDNSLK